MAICDYVALTAANVELTRRTKHDINTMIVVRLCQIYNFLNSGTPMPACDPDSLMADAGPILPRLVEDQKRVLMLVLLCDIGALLGGGGAGTGAVLRGAGPPVGLSPGTAGKIYYDTNTGVLYEQEADGTWPSP